MNEHFAIRQAESRDAKILVGLMEQMGYTISQEEMAHNLKIYISNPLSRVFLAVLNDHIIGCIALHVMEVFHVKERWARIPTLVIDQNYRRRGIGTQLIKAAEKFAKDIGCSIVELTSGMHRKKMGTHQFYDVMGYESNHSKLYLRKEI